MRRKTRFFTPEVTRFSIARLRLEVGTARWRKMTHVDLSIDGHQASVRIVELPHASSYTGRRRYLVCPRCGFERAAVIGFIAGIGFCCRTCIKWRGRVTGVKQRTALAALESEGDELSSGGGGEG